MIDEVKQSNVVKQSVNIRETPEGEINLLPRLIPPTKLPEVRVYVLTEDSLAAMEKQQSKSGLPLAISTFCGGVFVSSLGTLFARDDMHAQHPVMFLVFLSITLVSVAVGVASVVAWNNSRKLASDVYGRIRDQHSAQPAILRQNWQLPAVDAAE